MFLKIYERKDKIFLHSNAPLLDERIKYLRFWSKNGAVKETLQRIAQTLLIISECLNLKNKMIVTVTEIELAAKKWDLHRRKNTKNIKFATITKTSFIRHACCWLTSIKRLNSKTNNHAILSKQINQYVDYMRHDKGLSEDTIKVRVRFLNEFISFIGKSIKSLDRLSIALIDEVLKKKRHSDGCSRLTMKGYASIIRSYLIYVEERKWCTPGLAKSIKHIRVYQVGDTATWSFME